MNMLIYSTNHAIRRLARRNLSDEDIQFVLAHGQRVYRAGALHVFLGRRNIPSDTENYRRFARLEGTILVIDDTRKTHVLITAYRNRRGFKEIRKKEKYDKLHLQRIHRYFDC